MTIEELEDKHLFIEQSDADNSYDFTRQHRNLSIEFAISVLEEMLIATNDLYDDEFDYFHNDIINNKIQELKNYLNLV